MEIYLWLMLIFVVFSFLIGFLLGGNVGWKSGYNFYDRNKDIINKDNKYKNNNKYLACIICIYNDETCSMCNSCEERCSEYPSKFLAKKLPEGEK